MNKCEIALFSKNHVTASPTCEVDGSVMPAGEVGECLGFWWKGDLSASKSIEKNVQTARRDFFHFRGIGAFQGDISPLSSRAILETYVHV